ncbi:13601_t:CDS:1 [Gigaspora rosea]|nr:13601_t:CDS:1 [Gigaspora rosea]
MKRIFLELWPRLKFEEGIEWSIKAAIRMRILKAKTENLDFEIFEKKELLLFLKLKSDDEITFKMKDLKRHGKDDLKRLKRELRVVLVGKSFKDYKEGLQFTFCSIALPFILFNEISQDYGICL